MMFVVVVIIDIIIIDIKDLSVEKNRDKQKQ